MNIYSVEKLRKVRCLHCSKKLSLSPHKNRACPGWGSVKFSSLFFFWNLSWRLRLARLQDSKTRGMLPASQAVGQFTWRLKLARPQDTIRLQDMKIPVVHYTCLRLYDTTQDGADATVQYCIFGFRQNVCQDLGSLPYLAMQQRDIATTRHCVIMAFVTPSKYKNVRPTDPKWSFNIVLKGNATGDNFGGKKQRQIVATVVARVPSSADKTLCPAPSGTGAQFSCGIQDYFWDSVCGQYISAIYIIPYQQFSVNFPVSRVPGKLRRDPSKPALPPLSYVLVFINILKIPLDSTTAL